MITIITQTGGISYVILMLTAHAMGKSNTAWWPDSFLWTIVNIIGLSIWIVLLNICGLHRNIFCCLETTLKNIYIYVLTLYTLYFNIIVYRHVFW